MASAAVSRVLPHRAEIARPSGAVAVGRLVVGIALTAAIYIVAVRVGQAFTLVGGNASPVWPPAGIAVGLLFAYGRRLWPGVFVGAFIADLLVGAPLPLALGQAAAGTLEPLIAVGLLRRVRFRSSLGRPIDLWYLGVLGAAVPAGLAASVGVGGLALRGDIAPPDAVLAWLAWCTGDVLSVLVLGSLLLTWAAPAGIHRVRSRLGRVAEASIALASVAGLSVFLFFDVLDLRSHGQSVAFPIIPLIVLVAFRVGPRGVAVASTIFSTIAIAATEAGRGPFVGATREGSLMYVAVFIALASLTGLAVAASVAEREATGAELEATSRSEAESNTRMQAVESIGRRLASAGPSADALDAVVGLLHDVFGYEYPSIYTGDSSAVYLGAQRGYVEPVLTLDRSRGVIGRVLREQRAVFLPDVALDPDFVRADPAIVSEIAVPLMAQHTLLGVLNVESRRRLGERDVASVTVIGDRVGAALALARERDRLASRATLLRRLVEYSERIAGLRSEAAVCDLVVEAFDAVVPADLVGVTVLDQATGRYVIRAEKGSSGAVGREIEAGAGPAGQAIAARRLIEIDEYTRASFPAAVVATNEAPGYAHAIGIPLLAPDTGVLGALTVARVSEGVPFTDVEREGLELLGHEVALALSNARLHADVAELAVHDPLTGLHNRRYFDDALAQILAARGRLREDERGPVAAIMFDLDRFGEFNLQHGHQIGDDVLRTFAGILQARLRGSDLLARYGGEEFIGILVGAHVDDAIRVADEIRASLASTRLRGIDGRSLAVTVSAGCAELTEDAPTGEALIAAADVGLLMAKRSGRNVVVAA